MMGQRTINIRKNRMFREGLMRGTQAADVSKLTTAATRLSERLVVLIRRKLLLPTLHRVVDEDVSSRKPRSRARARPAASRVKRTPRRR